ncbi:phosphotriesterase [Kitasatospora sp. NPDC052896]|uniref:phosphotriesterase n=1 Tax=Kitasatospora sp. NPDC052896 TaxID=3364061 RepID=UPI0037C69F03
MSTPSVTTPAVRTVLGDLDPAELGVCDAHDHLFFRSPLLPGQELDDPAAAAAELAAFRAAGGDAVIQWSPYGLGRGAGLLPTLSQESGVHLVAATGLHQAAHYAPELPATLYGRLAELFVTELTQGIHGGPRAGMIKVAGGYHSLDEHTHRVMTAAAEAHHATGAPIGVHHELGTAAPAVLDLLCDRLGVPPRSVVLGHLNRFPDLRLYRELATSGAWLAFDGPSRANHATDPWLLDNLIALAEAGYGDRLLLGGDTTTAAARSVNAGPGMPFLLTTLRPRIARELGESQADQILRVNPSRAFATVWRTP